MKLSRTFPFIFGFVTLVALATGQSRAAAPLESKLRPLIESHSGKVAVAVRPLETGESFAWRADVPMPTASLIKVAVMIEAYRQADRGALDLERMVAFQKEDAAPGSGILTEHFSPGLSLSVRDAIRLMIVWSDNTATNLVLDQIGLAAVSKTMEDLGCPNTKIHAKVFRPDSSIFPERSKEFGLGSTTASEMVTLLERLHRRDVASETACNAMLDHLARCEDGAKLPRFLPPGTKVWHKTGSVSATRTDAGIIETKSGPVAVCVLTTENRDRRWEDDNAGNRLCAEVGKAVYEHFSPQAEQASDATGETTELKLGASGQIVEDLQRTLNARLSPSPQLSIDGDFGPATEKAVVQFQESKKLTADGVVRQETWEAMGPLVTVDPPVPDPEKINGEDLSREPADELDGPPFVTSKAWAIADARTGEVLWGHKENESRPMASTTKIMTALVVLKLAERDPAVLDEEVAFSEKADRTGGSSAQLRAGECLPVRELLYALLLPSGNDASVALAEHFGSRLESEGNGEAADPLARFVTEMNSTAKNLGLTETNYLNPHGLSEDGHRSSARDLTKLAWTAMQNPLFRDYVQTRQHACTVTGAGGYRRNVLWKNTNELLRTDGYNGIKTGTTGDAGACLVSQGRRGDDELLVVILGAASTESRYADTRNLFRWAWGQLAAE
jgi:D-alanyl-D-alanine carboxypeptidase (penicillin-binding protein 5/6)